MNYKDNKQPANVPISQGRYALTEHWSYTYDYQGKTYRINIPKGFEYDGASIPRIFWSALGAGRDGLHRAAVVVHDYLYHYDGKVPVGTVAELVGDRWQPLLTDFEFEREDADQLFSNILRDTGFPRWKRKVMYHAVDKFGWLKWK